MAARTARATALGALGAVLMAVVTWWLLREAVAGWPGPGTVRVDAALAFLATGVAGLAAGWAALLLAAATATLVRQRPVRERPAGAPALHGVSTGSPVGRGLSGRVAAGLLVAAGVGLAPAAAAAPTSVTVAASMPSTTAPQEGSGPTWAETTTDPSLPQGASVQRPERDSAGVPDAEELPVPGWTPTVREPERVKVVTGEVALVSTAAPAAAEVGDEVVVRRGDTLWSIAARYLGEHATDQDVAEAWPRWFAANKDTIGSDPDLILPGQRLVVPAHGGAR